MTTSTGPGRAGRCGHATHRAISEEIDGSPASADARAAGDGATSVTRAYAEAAAVVARWSAIQRPAHLRVAVERLRVWLANRALALLTAAWNRRARSRRASPARIVVYCVGILGDNVVALPALRGLRRRYPGARITVLVNVQANDSTAPRSLFRCVPWVDELRIVNDALVRREGLRVRFDDAALAGLRCDLFVNLSPFGKRGWLGAVLREALLARRLRAVRAVGFEMHSRGRGAYLARQVLRFPNEGRRLVGVVAPLGARATGDVELLLTPSPDAGGAPWCPLPSDAAAGRWVVMHPGAACAVKRWPAERFGQLARWMHTAYGVSVAVTGRLEETALCDEVVRASGGTAVSLAGRTSVGALAGLLRRAWLCVTNDTGTMHLAAAVDTPVVALFSSRSSPTWWYPAARRHAVVFRMLACSSCGKDEPSGCDHGCMLGITVDDVRQAVERLVGSPAATAGRDDA